MHYWEIWYPRAGATGILVARCRIEETDAVLLHAGGDVITVEVYDDERRLMAKGSDLTTTTDSPMCRLRMADGGVTREDFWPGDNDIGATVLLPGGEAAILTSWWNADDHSEWRWQVEFYNSRG